MTEEEAREAIKNSLPMNEKDVEEAVKMLMLQVVENTKAIEKLENVVVGMSEVFIELQKHLNK